MMVRAVSVMVADSQRLFARSLAATLDNAGGFEVLDASPVTGLETIKLLSASAAQCDLVILDYWIGGMTGPATTRAIRRTSMAPSVVLTGWFHSVFEVNEALRAGGAAFVSKGAGFSDLLETIRRVAAGDPSLYKVDGEGGLQIVEPPKPDRDEVWERLMTLTVREIEVLSLISFAPVEKVAKELSISLGTLRNHIYNILRKTHSRSQIEAIDIARRVGLIER